MNRERAKNQKMVLKMLKVKYQVQKNPTKREVRISREPKDWKRFIVVVFLS